MAEDKKTGKEERMPVEEFDFENFDTAGFDTGEIDSFANPEVESSSRTPVADVFEGAISGVLSETRSPDTLSEAFKEALPEQYGVTFDAVDQVASTATRLYDDAVKEVRPQLANMAKRIDKLVPAERAGLKKITSSISGFLGDETSAFRGPNKQDIQDQGIAVALSQIFNQQKENDDAKDAKAAAGEKIRDNIESKRFSSEIGVLTHIDQEITRQGAYSLQVTQAYQAKSLELQFRTLYVGQEQLETAQKYFETFRIQFDALAKNTALPEYVKLKNSERMMASLKGKFADKISTSLMGSDSPLKKALARLSGDVKGAVQGFKQGLELGSQGLDAAEQYLEMKEMMASMGMQSDSPLYMLFSEIGGMLGRKTIGRVSSKVREKLEENSNVGNMGHRWATSIINPGAAVEDFKKSDQWAKIQKDNPTLAKAMSYGFSLFRPEGIDTDMRNPLATSDPHGVKTFDNLAHKTITDIIPGLLGRIWQSVETFRTGEDPGELKYDHNAGGFKSRTKMKEAVEGRLTSFVKGSGYSGRAERITKHLFEGQDVDEHVEARVRAALTDMTRIDNFNFSKGAILETDAFKKLDQKTQEILERALTLKNTTDADHHEFTRRAMDLKNSVPDLRGEIETMIRLGYADLLEELKVVERQPDNSYRVDVDEYFKFVKKAGIPVPKGVEKVTSKTFRVYENPFPADGLQEEKKAFRYVLKNTRQKSNEEDQPPETPFGGASPDAPGAEPRPAADPPDGSIRSDITKKQDIKSFDNQKALDGLRKIGVYNWKYKPGKEPPNQKVDLTSKHSFWDYLQPKKKTEPTPQAAPSEEKTGPMAQDVKKNLGDDVAPGGKQIDLVNMNGVTMAAVKALDEKVQALSEPGTSEEYLFDIRNDVRAMLMITQAKALTGVGGGGGVGPGSADYQGLIGTLMGAAGQLMAKTTGDIFDVGKKVVVGTYDNVIKPGAEKAKDLAQKHAPTVKEGLKKLTGLAWEAGVKLFDVSKDAIMDKLPRGLAWVKKKAEWAKDKLSLLFNSFKDVYVKGRAEPALRAVLLRTGAYRDKVSGKVITSMSELANLKGDVVNEAGEVVLSLQDASLGLVDQYGDAVKSTARKIIGGVVTYGMKGLSRGKDFLLRSSRFLREKLGGVGGWMGDKVDSFFDKDWFNFGFGGEQGDKIHDVLVDIRELIAKQSPEGEKLLEEMASRAPQPTESPKKKTKEQKKKEKKKEKEESKEEKPGFFKRLFGRAKHKFDQIPTNENELDEKTRALVEKAIAQFDKTADLIASHTGSRPQTTEEAKDTDVEKASHTEPPKEVSQAKKKPGMFGRLGGALSSVFKKKPKDTSSAQQVTAESEQKTNPKEAIQVNTPPLTETQWARNYMLTKTGMTGEQWFEYQRTGVKPPVIPVPRTQETKQSPSTPSAPQPDTQKQTYDPYAPGETARRLLEESRIMMETGVYPARDPAVFGPAKKPEAVVTPAQVKTPEVEPKAEGKKEPQDKMAAAEKQIIELLKGNNELFKTDPVKAMKQLAQMTREAAREKIDRAIEIERLKKEGKYVEPPKQETTEEPQEKKQSESLDGSVKKSLFSKVKGFFKKKPKAVKAVAPEPTKVEDAPLVPEPKEVIAVPPPLTETQWARNYMLAKTGMTGEQWFEFQRTGIKPTPKVETPVVAPQPKEPEVAAQPSVEEAPVEPIKTKKGLFSKVLQVGKTAKEHLRNLHGSSESEQPQKKKGFFSRFGGALSRELAFAKKKATSIEETPASVETPQEEPPQPVTSPPLTETQWARNYMLTKTGMTGEQWFEYQRTGIKPVAKSGDKTEQKQQPPVATFAGNTWGNIPQPKTTPGPVVSAQQQPAEQPVRKGSYLDRFKSMAEKAKEKVQDKVGEVKARYQSGKNIVDTMWDNRENIKSGYKKVTEKSLKERLSDAKDKFNEKKDGKESIRERTLGRLGKIASAVRHPVEFAKSKKDQTEDQPKKSLFARFKNALKEDIGYAKSQVKDDEQTKQQNHTEPATAPEQTPVAEAQKVPLTETQWARNYMLTKTGMTGEQWFEYQRTGVKPPAISAHPPAKSANTEQTKKEQSASVPVKEGTPEEPKLPKPGIRADEWYERYGQHLKQKPKKESFFSGLKKKATGIFKKKPGSAKEESVREKEDQKPTSPEQTKPQEQHPPRTETQWARDYMLKNTGMTGEQWFEYQRTGIKPDAPKAPTATPPEQKAAAPEQTITPQKPAALPAFGQNKYGLSSQQLTASQAGKPKINVTHDFGKVAQKTTQPKPETTESVSETPSPDKPGSKLKKGLFGVASAVGGLFKKKKPEESPPQDDLQAKQNPQVAQASEQQQKPKEKKTDEENLKEMKDLKNQLRAKAEGVASGEKSFNDRDGSGKREGSWEERAEKQKAADAERHKRSDNTPAAARYKSEKNVIDTMMDKATGMFDFMRDKAGSILGGIGDILGLSGKKGILGNLMGLITSPFRAAGALGKTALTTAQAVGKPIAGAMRAAKYMPGISKVVRAAGMVRNAAMIGSLMTGGSGSVLLGMGSTAISAIGAALTAPVVIGAAVLAGTAYAGYKLYKHLKRNEANEFEDIRLKQYGLGANTADKELNHYVFALEDYLMDGCVGYLNGGAYFLDKRIDKEKLLEIFEIDKEDSPAIEKLTTWFANRFKPFFLTHMTALFQKDPKGKLKDIPGWQAKDKIDYLNKTANEGGPYSVSTSPFKTKETLNTDKTFAVNATKVLVDKITTKELKKGKDEKPPALPIPPVKPKEEKKEAPAVARPEIIKPTTDKKDIPLDTSGDGQVAKGLDKAAAANPTGTSAPLGASLSVAGGPLADGTSGSKFLALQKGVSLDGVNSALKSNLLAMAQEYGEKTGKSIPVTSGVRTRAQQEELHRRDKKAARPGTSLHEVENGGLAVDIDITTADHLDKLGLMRKYGLTRPVGGEPWHVEAAGIQGNITKAKNDVNWANEAIKNSIGRGGGGVGALGRNGYALGKRDPNASKLLDASAKAVKEEAPRDTIPTPVAAVSSDQGKTDQPASDKPTAHGAAVSTVAPKAAAAKDTPASAPMDGGQSGSKLGELPGAEADQSPKAPVSLAGDQAKAFDSTNKEAVKNKIAEVAKKQGEDPALLQTFAAIESRLNPSAKAGSSSAAGLFQFIRGTWKAMMARNAAKYGLDRNTPPTDPTAATAMAIEYIRENKRIISKVKPNPTPTDIYMAHFLGPYGAKSMLSAPDSAPAAQVAPRAAAANKAIFYNGSTAVSVGELKKKLADKITKRASEFKINLNNPQTPTKSKPTDSAQPVTPVVEGATSVPGKPSTQAPQPPSTSSKPAERPARLTPEPRAAEPSASMGSSPSQERPRLAPSYNPTGGDAASSGTKENFVPMISSIDKTLLESLDVLKAIRDAILSGNQQASSKPADPQMKETRETNEKTTTTTEPKASIPQGRARGLSPAVSMRRGS